MAHNGEQIKLSSLGVRTESSDVTISTPTVEALVPILPLRYDRLLLKFFGNFGMVVRPSSGAAVLGFVRSPPLPVVSSKLRLVEIIAPPSTSVVVVVPIT